MTSAKDVGPRREGSRVSSFFTGYALIARFPADPSRLVEVLWVLAMVSLAGLSHFVIGLFFRGVAVMPLTSLAIAAATLAAGARSGLVTLVGCQFIAWYYLTAEGGKFLFEQVEAAVGFTLSSAAQLLILWLAASYRSAIEASQRRAEATDELVVRQQELWESRRNLEAIYRASGEGLVLCKATFNEQGQVAEYQALEVNPAHAELTGASRETMLSRPISTIAPPIDARWFETAQRVLKTGAMTDFDVFSSATGRWLNVRVSRVSDTRFQQTFVDVSDRRGLEEQRRALMKEMNHRVMNNFQTIVSFLHLQAATATATAKVQLQTAARRVQVLASLHALLAYRDGDEDIDAAEYVEELCAHLQASVARPECVEIACTAERRPMPADVVIPLGFIVSELVTNSAKYAYPPPASGVIRIRLAPRGEGWVLTVEDDGGGLSDTTDTPRGLGMRLVQQFVRQIGAELATTSARGVRHEIVYRPRCAC